MEIEAITRSDVPPARTRVRAAYVVKDGELYLYRPDLGKGRVWALSCMLSAAHRFPSAGAARRRVANSSQRVVRVVPRPRLT